MVMPQNVDICNRYYILLPKYIRAYICGYSLFVKIESMMPYASASLELIK